VDHSDDAGDGTFVCKHCGEVMEEIDMGMHIAYTHGLVMLVEE
jgi:transcription initiation factor IIE alpha subunit